MGIGKLAKKVWRSMNAKAAADQSPFLRSPAISRLFPGENLQLPPPLVNEPSPDQLSGRELPDFPLYLAVEVTNACNLRCEHCNYRFGVDHYTRDRGFMDEAVFDKILAEAVEHKITLLMNYDGEPFMHPKFMEYLRKVSDAGLNSYFNTNATMLNEKAAEELLSFYRGSVFFSIDGNKEWFEKIRKPAKYDQVCANVRNFIAANERHGWPATVCINFCNLDQSREERREFVDTWLPLVNYVSIGETNDKFGACSSQPIISMDLQRRPVCVVPWATCGIGHNGDVIPCSIYITRANTADAIFGNVTEQSIAEIWKNGRFAEFRRTLAEKRQAGTYCEKCERWLSQFSFPDEERDGIIVRRNAFWTTFQNTARGKLNFM